MKLVITISGSWTEGLDDDAIESLKEELEGECRYQGAWGVTVEVDRT